MEIHELLYLDHRYILAAPDDNILGATGDAYVAVLVFAGEIASFKPAILIDGVELRPLKITDKGAVNRSGFVGGSNS